MLKIRPMCLILGTPNIGGTMLKIRGIMLKIRGSHDQLRHGRSNIRGARCKIGVPPKKVALSRSNFRGNR